VPPGSHDGELGVFGATGLPFNPGLEMKRVSVRCNGLKHLIAAIDHSGCNSECRILVKHIGAFVVRQQGFSR